MCGTTAMQQFHLVTFDLTLTLSFTQYEATLIRYLLYPLGSFLAKRWFAADISPVSVADKAKSDDF